MCISTPLQKNASMIIEKRARLAVSAPNPRVLNECVHALSWEVASCRVESRVVIDCTDKGRPHWLISENTSSSNITHFILITKVLISQE